MARTGGSLRNCFLVPKPYARQYYCLFFCCTALGRGAGTVCCGSGIEMSGAGVFRMLTVDPAERITADQALQHPWVMSGDDELAESQLGDSLQRMRVFNARRKFKSAIATIIMTMQ